VSKNVLALGPFIGSFEQEFLTFRPHMRWIEENTETDFVYYSSHFNRKFLYPQVTNKKYIPVYKQLTRQEIHQTGYSHKDVDQRDFMSLIAHWPLNGNLDDISGNDHIVTGSPTSVLSGKIGSCYDFSSSMLTFDYRADNVILKDNISIAF